MKLIRESVFMSAIRAFFVSLFSVVGALIGISLIVILLAALLSLTDEKSFSSKVKIQPDAEGSRVELSSDHPVLLQISINGEIGKEEMTGEKIETILLDSREDDFKSGRVKGILLVINSPGGGVNESDIIYHHLKQYKERYHVPIFAYVNGLCASGGYYISCAADKILASDVSLVGSIGVLSWPPFVNVYDAMEKLGINSMTLVAGKGKDEMNPFRPWKDNEQSSRQGLLDFYYQRFVTIVTQNRPNVNPENLIDEYGAQVFPSSKAQEIGLIDGSGYFLSGALKELALAAGIPETQKYQVVSFETKSWLKKLKEQSHSPLWTGKIKHELSLPKNEGNPFSYIFVP